MQNFTSTKTVFISIVGKPNSGKSSLLNMMLNYKTSIVSPKPQTTRGRVTGILTDKDTQVIFTDTPGILKAKTMLGKYMENEINDTLSGSDACLHVVEAGKPISLADYNVINNMKSLRLPAILAINKIDLIKQKSILIKQMDAFYKKFNYDAVIPVSSMTGEGKRSLIDEIKSLASPSVFYFPEDQVTDQGEDKLFSEIVREKALRLLDQEIPHGIAVHVDSVKRRKNGLTDIDITIYCERDNHKGIIIGKGGSMLKKIGSYARVEIEENLGCKVNLNIWVKVKENWKNKESILKSLGYMH